MAKRTNTVIMLSGYKRAGKDFVSALLNKRLEDSKIYSFAEPLKDIIATTLGISLKELELFKNNPTSFLLETSDESRQMHLHTTNYRSVLQIFGTEATKIWFGDTVWSDLFLRQNYVDDYLIISDSRFELEITELRKAYDRVITVKVIDSNIVNTDLHTSETALDRFTFDYYIDNTAKDSSIIEAVDKFVGELTNGKI